MALSKNKILLLVEGYKTEPYLMEMYANALKEDFELNVVSFGTNIYVLYQSIKALNSQFGSDSTSTLEMLKSILKERESKLDEIKNLDELTKIRSDLKILEDKFPYIYLLFDLEMQDNHFNDEEKKSILLEMKEYFNDETENGLLLINYPMIESFRDYQRPAPSDEYFNRYIEKHESKKYKEIVDRRGNNLNLGKYSKTDFENITLQNILKVNYLLENIKDSPSYHDFLNYIQNDSIINKQFEFMEQENKIYILCCGLFVYISFFGRDYYTRIVNR